MCDDNNVTNQSAQTSLWLDLAALSLIAIMGLVPYLGILNHEFVNLDDTDNFILNEHYREISIQNLSWGWNEYYLGHWHPLTWFSLSIDHQLSGGGENPNPISIKIGNLVLHILNAFLVYRLAITLFKYYRKNNSSAERNSAAWLGSVLAAMIFLLHPQRVESVAWATERRDVLSTFFYLFSILLFVPFLNRRSPIWLLGSILLFIASLLSKAWGITLPAVLILIIAYHYFCAGKSKNESMSWKKVGLAIAIYSIFAAPVAFWAISAQDATGALVTEQMSLSTRFIQMVISLAWYPFRLFIPIGLYPAYLIPPNLSFSHPSFLMSLIFLVILAGLSWGLRRKLPVLWLIIAIYLVIVSPVSGIAQSGFQLVADRYGYISLIPFWIGAGILFANVFEKVSGKSRVLVLLFSFSILACFSILTHHQVAHWRNSETLFSHTLRCDPDNYVAFKGRGAFYLYEQKSEQNSEQGIEDLYAGIDASEKQNAFAWAIDNAISLATWLEKHDRIEEAVSVYGRVLAIAPNHPQANLAILDLDVNTLSPAQKIERLYATLVSDPENPTILGSLGSELISIGQFDQAAEVIEKAIRYSKDQPVAANFYNYGLCLQYRGNRLGAESYYLRAVKLDETHVSAHNQLGVIYQSTNRLSDAKEQFERVHQLDSDHINSYYNLGLVYRL